MNEIDIFYPTSQAAWRQWLVKYHLSKSAVWLVFYRKSSNKPSLTWSEAVDVALCFGWIDSKKVKIDDEASRQLFSRRKPQSTWSKINKEKVQRLIAEGRMETAGYESIEIARQNGSWTLLDDVEELKIPDDLEIAFARYEGAKDYFLGLSKTAKKRVLQWVVLARRPETRQKRITEIAELAAENKLPRAVDDRLNV